MIDCSFCELPVSMTYSYIFLYSVVDDEFVHPCDEGRRVVLAGHGDCAPDTGYDIPLTSVLHLDDPGGPFERIKGKRWCSPLYLSELRRLFLLLNKIAYTDKDRRKIPAGMRARVLERDEFKCRRCGFGAPIVRLVVDHIDAVASGGRSSFWNLQTLCVRCNLGKAAREPTEHDRRGILSLDRPPICEQLHHLALGPSR